MDAGGDAGVGASTSAIVDAIFAEASDWSYREYDFEEPTSALSTDRGDDSGSLDDHSIRSTEGQVDLVASQPKGHHYVPRQIFDNEPLQDATRQVFDNARTGLLRNPPSNYYDRMHIEYNAAVREAYDDFLKEKGTSSERMTPEQAREFVDRVIRSGDSRIRGFNMRLWLREIMSRVPRRPDI